MSQTNLKNLAVLALGLASLPALAATELARVLSSTPVIINNSAPQEYCGTIPVRTTESSSGNPGAGAIFGAIAGGLLGHAVGGGTGRDLATAAGVMGGAVLGHEAAKGQTRDTYEEHRICSTDNSSISQTTVYNVVYEYGGKPYSVQLPYSPGATIEIEVTPTVVGQSSSMTTHWAPANAGNTTIISRTEYVPQVVYLAPRPYYGVYPQQRPPHYRPHPYPRPYSGAYGQGYTRIQRNGVDSVIYYNSPRPVYGR